MEFEFKIKLDKAGADKKTRTLAMIPDAFFRQGNKWAAETIKRIKERLRSGEWFKREPKELAQRLDFRATRHGAERMDIMLGTGRYIGRPEVVYAAIQERGGAIYPKTKKALTIPFSGVRHSANMYRGMGSFIVRLKDGRAIIAMMEGKRGGGRLKPLFLLSGGVRLKGRRWWSKSIAERRPVLERMVSKVEVLKKAEEMAGKVSNE